MDVEQLTPVSAGVVCGGKPQSFDRDSLNLLSAQLIM